MDEATIKEAKRTNAEDVTRARDIEAMMNTAGWKAYHSLLNGQVLERTQNLFEPTPDDAVMKSEHNKGVLYGLILARDLPSVIVQTAKDARRAAGVE
jgi:hypothetical protein